MPERDTERLEETSSDPEVLEEMRRIEEKSSSRSPYFDNIHGYQELGELSKVQDWAKEMEKRDHVVGEIRPNVDDRERPDDPPDVLAEIDGELVGIEVTDLMEYVSERMMDFFGPAGVTRLTWRLRRGQVEPGSFCWDGAACDEEKREAREKRISENPWLGEAWVTWSLESFQRRLREIVEKKDKKIQVKKESRLKQQGQNALEFRLRGSFLLVFTPELYLQDDLEEYVEKTKLPRPGNFDRVFLMGDYVAGQPEGRHPVFEVRLTRRIEPSSNADRLPIADASIRQCSDRRPLLPLLARRGQI